MLAEKMGVTNKQGMEWLDAFVDLVTNTLRKGEIIHIAASKKPRFTAGKLLKEAIK